MLHFTRKFLVSFLLILAFLFPLCADILTSPTWGYSIDLPEGFILTDSQGTDRFMFQHTKYPVSVILAAYPEGRHKDAHVALSASLSSLQAEFDISEIEWRNTDCAVGNFDFTLDYESETGWGVAAGLPEGGHIVVLSWCPVSQAAALSQFVISCVDALCIDRGSWYEAGPVTAFAYPAEGRVTASTEIDGKRIQFTLDKSDLDADLFVVEREYDVLCMYDSNDSWEAAWQRYYRQIFRNEYSRLKQAAFAIRNALGVKKTQEELAQTLLTWTQGFEYANNTNSADFTPAVGALLGDSCDCDSRAMLLAILLRHMDAKTCIFVSMEYSHSVFGIASELSGAKIEMDGTWYLLGETTKTGAKLGMMLSTMTDSRKWLSVPLAGDE